MTERLLDNINSPQDLKKLKLEQLNQLAREIRQLIKETVSKNGGHLASNLGVIELTIALHYVFDFAADRLVWDVGHQCYVHKILTGRGKDFSKLRQPGGLSGFPNPAESKYDQFSVGHAGTSVATAVGLSLGAQIKKTSEKVVALVGDASIVNGLSFEGLNNMSLLKRQMLIVFNDNFMAIDKTKGAFAEYLTRFRVSRPYEVFRRRTQRMVRQLPFVGDALEDTLHRVKDGLKTTLHQDLGRFEQLGIPTFGPIDGHDVISLIKLLEQIKDVDHPVLLHVLTEKGRGFTPAREDPCTFHSPQPFKVDGETASFSDKSDKSFTRAFADSLTEIMKRDKTVMALTAAMPDGTGLAQVREVFPDRVFDVGIAESAAVDIAAGMAKVGLKPVVCIYSTFLQRSFDQIFQEVSLQNLPVIFCMDRAGMVGGDGAVHHGFCDTSLLRTLVNLEVMAPCCEAELRSSLEYAVNCGRPVAIRYPRDRVAHEDELPDNYACPVFEKGRAHVLKSGSDATILAYGAPVIAGLTAAKELAKEGLDVAVISARFAKPLDGDLLRDIFTNGTGPIITVEDHTLIGGFGSAVLEFAADEQLDARRITRLGLADEFVGVDSRAGQLRTIGIDAQSIGRQIRQLLQKK